MSKHEQVLLMKNDCVIAHCDGEFVTISDYSRNVVALTKNESIELAKKIIRHYGVSP